MFSSLPTTMARASGPASISQELAWQEALAKVRAAIGCGNTRAAVRGLLVALGGNRRAFHDALLKLLDSASSQMRQQLIDEARRQCAGFALDAHDREGKTALDLAVRHNDMQFADYLLRQGVNPERTSLAGATADMQALVSRWRLKNLLYANRGETPQRSDRLSSSSKGPHAEPDYKEKWALLGHALSQGRHKEADELLQKMMGGNSPLHNFVLWRMAMADKRHDVLGAMVVLRPDALRELGLLHQGTNPGRTSLVGAIGMQARMSGGRQKNLPPHADRGETSQRPGELPSSSKGPHAEPDYKEKWALLGHALSQGRHKEADELLQEIMGGNSLLHNFVLWHMAMADKRHDVLGAMVVLRPDALCELGLLRQESNPERTSLAGPTGDMRARMSGGRQKNLPYADRGETSQRPGKLPLSSKGRHAGSDREKWTPLDHALSKGSYKEADELLQKEADELLQQEMFVPDPDFMLWHGAMADKRHDILRAMLILRPDALRKLAKDKQEVGMWLNEVRQDPGLSAVLKEFPYQAAKRGAPDNHNGKAQFRGTAEKIKCRHLATYQQEVQARDPKIKFDYGKFGSVEAIANNPDMHPDIEKTYETLKAQASATHLIDNSKFGQFLVRQFHEMEGEDKPATRLMLVESINHVMNLGLMIKEEEGKKSYVVKFFDPNESETGTHSKASSVVQTFERQTIKDYLSDKNYLDYYPEAKGLSMIFVRPKVGERTGASAVPSSAGGRRLTTCIDIKEVNATAVWHFMDDGFDANLRELPGHLATLPEAQRIKVLSGKDARGYPALLMGMIKGHLKAIEAYGEAVKLLSPDKQADLLLAKISTGEFAGRSGFISAVEAEQFGAANAQLQLLVQLAPRLSEGKRAELRKELQGYRTFSAEKNKMSRSPYKMREFSKMLATLSKLEGELGKKPGNT